MNNTRVIVASLTLSVAGFIGIMNSESFVPKAMIPTQGDRPTLGFGSTFHEDGTPVKMGETTTPARALVMAKAHISKDEALFRKSLEGAYLNQEEFDVYMDWTYQFGTTNWLISGMRRNILAGNYSKACDSLLMWKKAGGFDCSTPGNKRCAGVWTRQLERHKQCKAAQ